MRDKKIHAEHERCRKLAKTTWTAAFGPIPKDAHGRPHQIHHKDRNWRNNSLDNLLCVSRQEHDLIHHEERRIWSARSSTGRSLSEATKQKLRLVHLGKTRSAETRAKIAACRRGKPMAEETKKKLAVLLIGKNKGHWKSQEEISRREQTKAAKRAEDSRYGRAIQPCHGERHPRSHLTAAGVVEIRSLYAAGGITHKELAHRFGVRDNTISKVIRRKLWAHVP